VWFLDELFLMLDWTNRIGEDLVGGDRPDEGRVIDTLAHTTGLAA
jgi:hypothetical protein